MREWGWNAGWDMALLRVELSDLKELGFNLDLTGFGGVEVDQLFGPRPGLTDPDDVPPLPTEPVSKPGDLWICGRHRLLCGDSTVATDVKRVLGGVEPHLMVTDPPYGVSYDAAWRNEAMPQTNDPRRWKDGAGRATGTVLNDDRADWSASWTLFAGNVAYVWHGATHTVTVANSLKSSGLEVRSQIVWVKNQFVISRGHYHPQHEPCFYVIRKGETGHWNGDRKQSTVWQINKPVNSETGHSTQKPVECMRRPIENNSSPGQAVYDPFLGSGTTMIAAEQTGRACDAIEIAPAYVDVAVQRWQDFTGEQAILEGDGRTFAAIGSQRTQPI
jgi:DNA modification methylase